MKSEKRSKGIVRRKFDILVLKKEAIRFKPSRFGKSKIIDVQTASSSPARSIQNGHDQPLIQMPSIVKQQLPPKYVDKYEECQSLIREIDQLKKTMAIEQNRRLSCIKESEEKAIDQKIYNCANQATKKIRQCQSILTKISKEGENESQFDKKACQSICKKLALQIQQKTRQMRAQQRAFIEYRKQIENTTKVSFLQLTAQKMLEDPYMYEQMQEQQSLFDKQRNQQLINIVNSIHELNDIYKQLNQLVIMQGSLLDRIDMNIETSVAQVKDGVQALGRAQKHQKNKTGCIVMIIMIVVICILGIILLIKHR